MTIIESWKSKIDKHHSELKKFINENREVCNIYEKSKKETFDIGFNIFTLSSDFYYRENFHSDIIKSLLDPSEKHNEKNKYLHIFIDMLNKINSNNNINKFDFENSIVLREKNNIDILITDSVSNKAILIENKINNAVDQKRQLPKYYNLISEKFKVECVIYLTLGSNKRPDKNDWTNEEIIKINKILTILPSFDKTNINLFHNWIVPSIIESNNSDSLFLLKQYGNLIKQLNINTMDTVSLEKFLDTLKENDNLKTSISIKNMLNDLPEYLAIRIEDKYKNNCYPFKNIWRYQKSDTVFEAFKLDNLYLKIDVFCTQDGYFVHFWNPENEEYDVKENLKDFKSIIDFEYNSDKKNKVVKRFNLFEEENLFDFLDLIKVELESLKK